MSRRLFSVEIEATAVLPEAPDEAPAGAAAR